MNEYRVIWEIDVVAESPEAAARQARDYQLMPDAQVGYFEVFNSENKFEIDLDNI